MKILIVNSLYNDSILLISIYYSYYYCVRQICNSR